MRQVVIQAFYETSKVLEYAGNPLIEGLPAILSEEEAAEAIASIPPLPGDERALPKEIRLHCINRVSHLIQPFSIHLELEAVISSVLRSGYIGRNPMDAATWRHLHSIRVKGASSFINATASTFSLIGLSGMGKTTALKAILKLYPQVIQHTRYHGRDFIHTQIVWLRFDCPNDGSLLGLCQAFFRAVDAALGDNIHAAHYRAKRYSADLLLAMEQVASTYFIGAIFIDELQHLNSAKATERESMLNFFVNLINALGIPVVFVGTNPMAKLFADVVRNARRASGQGVYDFKHPRQSDPTWDLLLTTVWEYQWVQRPVELTDELRNTIYDLTQGVTDFLAKLMILGQRYAIQSNIEQLDATVLTHVANTKMKLLLPAIDALRSRDPEKMSRFEDLLPLDVQLDQMMRDDLYVIPNALSVLRAKQQTMLANAAAKTALAPVSKGLITPSYSPIDDVTGAGLSTQRVTQANAARVVPISAKILDVSQTMDVLGANGWLVSETFEFEPAYRAA
jgi:hypothetical protein